LPRMNTPRKAGATPFQLAIIYLRANRLALVLATGFDLNLYSVPQS